MVALVKTVTDPDAPAQHFEEVLAGYPHTDTWVLASELSIPPEYQGAPVQKWIDHIAGTFDPVLLEPLRVNRREDGTLVVVDGKHRLLAIRQMGYGDQNVPCRIWNHLSLEMEAKLYNTQDARRALKAQERFRAWLIEGKPEASYIQRVVEASGYHLNLHDGDLSNGKISAVASLTYVTTQYRPGTLQRTLGLARDGFGTETGIRHLVIRGLAVLVYNYDGVYDRKRIVEALRKTSPGRLEADGKDVARVNGLRHPEGVSWAIVNAYNRRLPEEKKLPPPKLRRGPAIVDPVDDE